VVRIGKFKAVRVILIQTNRTIEKSPRNCLNLDALCFLCDMQTRYLSLLLYKTRMLLNESANISEEKKIYIYIIQSALEIYTEFNTIRIYRLSDIGCSITQDCSIFSLIYLCVVLYIYIYI